MGVYGPVPKRDDERIRRNKPDVETTTIKIDGPVIIPELGIDDPHPIVAEFWDSLKISGQSKYYESSDWIYAKLVLTLIHQSLTSLGYISAAQLQQYNAMFSNLLVCEGDRRRVRMEIERRPLAGVDGTVVNASDRFKARFTRPVGDVKPSPESV